jgi:hypothetical protein
MKLLFAVKDQVHVFTVRDQISNEDLLLVRQSLALYFESMPAYVVLDLSQARLDVAETELHAALSELKSIAQASNLSFVVAQTDIESLHAQSLVVAAALQKKVDVLERRLKLQSEVKDSITNLKSQNETLKNDLKANAKPADKSSHVFSPLVERLWSESK